MTVQYFIIIIGRNQRWFVFRMMVEQESRNCYEMDHQEWAFTPEPLQGWLLAVRGDVSLASVEVYLLRRVEYVIK